MELEATIDKIKDFLEANKTVFNADIGHFNAVSKVIGGNWDEETSALWEKVRGNSPKRSYNVVAPFIDKVVAKFTTSPLKFTTDSTDIEQFYDERSFQSAFEEALRDSVQAGKGYLMMYVKNERMHFKRLLNTTVVYTDDIVIYIDRKPKSEEEKATRTVLPIGELNIEYDKKFEKLELTVWETAEDHCESFKIDEFGNIYDQEQIPTPHIPIVMMTGDEVWNDDRKTFRGCYSRVWSLLNSLNCNVSLFNEKTITAPNFKFWVGSSLASDSQFMKNLRSSNIGPSAAMVYPDMVNGERTDPPTPNTLGIGAEEVVANMDTIIGMISNALGDIGAEDAPSGATAEEILYRRENQLAAYNKFIFSSNNAARKMATIMGIMLGIEIDVVGGPYEVIRNQDITQKIIAFAQYAQDHPPYAPLTINYLDVPQEVKDSLRATVSFNPQQMAQDLQAAQAAVNELAPQVEQLTTERDDAMKALEDYRAQMAIEIDRIRLDYESKMAKLEADNSTKLAVEQMKIEASQVEKMMDQGYVPDNIVTEEEVIV
jgi:hypothetical protein